MTFLPSAEIDFPTQRVKLQKVRFSFRRGSRVGELAAYRVKWIRIIRQDMVPHTGQPHPEIMEMDCGLVRGPLRVKLHAANAGNILGLWSMGCSVVHNMCGYQFKSWLKDHLALYGIKNAILAPGYSSSYQKMGEQ